MLFGAANADKNNKAKQRMLVGIIFGVTAAIPLSKIVNEIYYLCKTEKLQNTQYDVEVYCPNDQKTINERETEKYKIQNDNY